MVASGVGGKGDGRRWLGMVATAWNRRQSWLKARLALRVWRR